MMNYKIIFAFILVLVFPNKIKHATDVHMFKIGDKLGKESKNNFFFF